LGFGVAVGAAVGLDVGTAVGLAVGAVVGFAVGAAVGLAVAVGFGVAVADGLEVGLAVGVAVGFAVGAVVGFTVAVAEGFAVALLPEDGLLVVFPELGFVVAEGFAVALGFDAVLLEELEDDGLLVVLLSVLDETDELLSFELSVFASGVAVGFALAVLELADGLLLSADALLSSFFSDTVLLTALDAELSVTALSVLLPAHAASDTVSAAAINIAVISFFIVVHSSLVSL
jgi:hypothetical protein